eukprot:scaffold185129_cov51-Attheya_sp.AAC.1
MKRKEKQSSIQSTTTAFHSINTTLIVFEIAVKVLTAPLRMSHVMGDIPIKLQKSSTATKDEDDDKVLTQRLEQLYDDGKRKNEVP